jgi:hypothetical protein
MYCPAKFNTSSIRTNKTGEFFHFVFRGHHHEREEHKTGVGILTRISLNLLSKVIYNKKNLLVRPKTGQHGILSLLSTPIKSRRTILFNCRSTFKYIICVRTNNPSETWNARWNVQLNNHRNGVWRLITELKR